MKKKLPLIVIIWLASFHLQAKKIEGEIIFGKDTIHVTFHIPLKLFSQQPDYEKLQHRIKFVDGSGKKKVLKPSQATEIRFEYASQQIRMLSRTYQQQGYVFSTNKPKFLHLQIDGEIKLFSYYTSRPFSAGIAPMTANSPKGGGVHRKKIDLIQKGDGELKKPRPLAFRQDMIAYFNDCQPLVEKMDNKVFRKKDLDAIIQFYNATCGE